MRVTGEAGGPPPGSAISRHDRACRAPGAPASPSAHSSPHQQAQCSQAECPTRPPSDIHLAARQGLLLHGAWWPRARSEVCCGWSRGNVLEDDEPSQMRDVDGCGLWVVRYLSRNLQHRFDAGYWRSRGPPPQSAISRHDRACRAPLGAPTSPSAHSSPHQQDQCSQAHCPTPQPPISRNRIELALPAVDQTGTVWLPHDSRAAHPLGRSASHGARRLRAARPVPSIPLKPCAAVSIKAPSTHHPRKAHLPHQQAQRPQPHRQSPPTADL